MSVPTSSWNTQASSELMWYLESGASHYVSLDLAILASLQSYNGYDKLLISKDECLTISSVGFNSFDTETFPKKTFILHNIFLVSHIAKIFIECVKIA